MFSCCNEHFAICKCLCDDDDISWLAVPNGPCFCDIIQVYHQINGLTTSAMWIQLSLVTVGLVDSMLAGSPGYTAVSHYSLIESAFCSVLWRSSLERVKADLTCCMGNVCLSFIVYLDKQLCFAFIAICRWQGGWRSGVGFRLCCQHTLLWCGLYNRLTCVVYE